MHRTRFDFDVISGPVPPRPAPKPDAKPTSADSKPPAVAIPVVSRHKAD